MIYQRSCPWCGGEATSGGFLHRPECRELNFNQKEDKDINIFPSYSFKYETNEEKIIRLLEEILDILKKKN